jgi:hypothetical protein
MCTVYCACAYAIMRMRTYGSSIALAQFISCACALVSLAKHMRSKMPCKSMRRRTFRLLNGKHTSYIVQKYFNECFADSLYFWLQLEEFFTYFLILF